MLSIGIGLTSVPVLARRGPAYDPDALAFFARLTNQPTDARKKLYSDLIASLKTAGVWAKLDALYILAAADAQAARQNLVANAYNLAAVGSPTFTADRGYTGDGATSYLDTGANRAALTNYTRDSASLFAWENQESTSSGAAIGSPPSVTQATIIPRGGANFIGRVNDTGVQSSIASSMGLSAGDRPSSTNSYFYRNGSQVFTAAVSSLALTTGNFTLLAGNNGAANFRASRLACAGFGASLGGGGQASLSTILNIFITAVGAN